MGRHFSFTVFIVFEQELRKKKPFSPHHITFMCFCIEFLESLNPHVSSEFTIETKDSI